MWDEVSAWSVFSIGLAIGLVIGGYAGASWILLKFWWRKTTRGWEHAREGSVRVLRLGGILAGLALGSVLVLYGAVAGWWSA
jgi:hypothetical protein